MKNLFVVILLGIYPFYINAQANRDCRAMPPFTAKIGFDITRSYFSTSEKRTMGFVYVETTKGTLPEPIKLAKSTGAE